METKRGSHLECPMEVELGGRMEVEQTCELDSWEVGAETRGGARNRGEGQKRRGRWGSAWRLWSCGKSVGTGERRERGSRWGVGGGLERGEKEEDDDIIYMWSSLRVGWVFYEKSDKFIGFNGSWV